MIALKKIRFLDFLYMLIGALLLCGGAIIAPMNHYVAGLLLILGAIGLYFYIVYVVAERDWLDIRAVFSGMWFLTVGLAALRLADYQEPWQTKTWICHAIAYVAFAIGGTYGRALGEKVYDWIHSQKRIYGRLKFEFKENRLYWICIGITLAGIVCFAFNIYIKGYVPFFSSRADAYLKFYTKFHMFSVASTMISGLCYYCIMVQKGSVIKKIILWLCIAYATFIFPTLVISRGTFVTSALSLATAIFYVHGKKLRVLITSVIVILGIYMVMSSARGYTDAQLNTFFEPSEIEVTKPSDDEDGGDGIIIVLPPKLAFLYSYLTVSHDNFNEAVQHSKGYTFGLRQVAPFNVILRIDQIDEIVEDGEYYLVRKHLNTVNLIGDFYYDLHELGVALFMLLWGCIFCMIQAYFRKGKGVFALWALGNTMTPIVMCFFASWMSVFSQWMHWGTCLIACLMACVNILPKTDKSTNRQNKEG